MNETVYHRPKKSRITQSNFGHGFKACTCGSNDVELKDAGNGAHKIVCNSCLKETAPARIITTVRGYWNKLNMPK